MTYLTPEEVNYFKTKSCSLSNFAVNLMLKLFSKQELVNERHNVLGRKLHGSSESKIPLDVDRMDTIRHLVLDSVDGTDELKDKQCKSATKAMTKKISAFRLRAQNSNDSVPT